MMVFLNLCESSLFDVAAVCHNDFSRHKCVSDVPLTPRVPCTFRNNLICERIWKRECLLSTVCETRKSPLIMLIEELSKCPDS